MSVIVSLAVDVCVVCAGERTITTCTDALTDCTTDYLKILEPSANFLLTSLGCFDHSSSPLTFYPIAASTRGPVGIDSNVSYTFNSISAGNKCEIQVIFT